MGAPASRDRSYEHHTEPPAVDPAGRRFPETAALGHRRDPATTKAHQFHEWEEDALPGQKVVFGFGAHSGIDEVPELLRTAQWADRDGLDIFSLSDHP